MHFRDVFENLPLLESCLVLDYINSAPNSGHSFQSWMQEKKQLPFVTGKYIFGNRLEKAYHCISLNVLVVKNSICLFLFIGFPYRYS